MIGDEKLASIQTKTETHCQGEKLAKLLAIENTTLNLAPNVQIQKPLFRIYLRI